MQLKAKFLTAVWGETYINRFCSLSLPSFLAAGNIPALAQAVSLEVVILTRRSDIGYFARTATFQRLKALCPVRFVEIDDLIGASVYGVTLTLAYTRAIIACGEEMVNTYFVFMNADFVLANGSLLALCGHMEQGRSIVLAPSFRSIAEELEAKLKALVMPGGTLDVAPRALVGMALASPHRTTVAKMCNQAIVHSTHPNQFFWQVDQTTVLARYFLIFMLCLRPERVIKTINGYCDYSFVPELCPSGDEVVMDDSDKFFMLELQSREQETMMLRFGHMSAAQIARSLSRWTTAEHRRASNYDIVFHSRDIPAKIDLAKADARAFIDDIVGRLGPARSHIDHHYWVMGVEAWKQHRGRRSVPVEIPELGRYRTKPGVRLRLLRTRAGRQLRATLRSTRGLIWGGFSARSLMSPNWADYQLLVRTIEEILADAGAEEVLVVGERDQMIGGVTFPRPKCVLLSPRELVRTSLGSTKLPRGTRFSHVLLYVCSTKVEYVRDLFERCYRLTDQSGTFCIFVKHDSTIASHGEFSRLLLGLGDAFRNRAQSWSFQTAGGRLVALSGRLSNRVAMLFGAHYSRFRNWAILWMLPAFVAAHTLAFMGNLCLYVRWPRSKLIRGCGSLLLRAKIWDDESGPDRKGRRSARSKESEALVSSAFGSVDVR